MPRDFRPGGDSSGGLYARVNPYPLPRGDRRQPIPTNSDRPVTVTAPTVYLWAFHVREAGITFRASVTSRRVRGPALIDTLSVDMLLTAATGAVSLQIGYSVSQLAEASNVSGIRPTGVTWLYEKSWQDDGGFSDVAVEGPTFGYGEAATVSHDVKIGYPIQLPEFFVIININSPNVNAQIANGSLRILENVDPDLLADLVAS